MKIINVRNVHDAIPEAADLLRREGIDRDSRNGPVRMMPEPVTTVYSHPQERVVFWPQRDANPFFHLYEAHWMLAGRNDVAPLLPYAKQMAEYSDNGSTLHAAYGYRWRWQLRLDGDQLIEIISRLKRDPDDRRCVLQIWDSDLDLGTVSKDIPCNLTVTFQINYNGALDMVVFNRSNDIVWGCYGANAVHFSLLQEYVASAIGCGIGTYTQVSVNWHAYLATLNKFEGIDPDTGYTPEYLSVRHPYVHCVVPMSIHMGQGQREYWDGECRVLLDDAEQRMERWQPKNPWFRQVRLLLRAHRMWREMKGLARYDEPMTLLTEEPGYYQLDWFVAATEWLGRRRDAFVNKQAREHTTLGEA